MNPNPFDNLYHPPDHPIDARLVSKEVNKKNEPIVEIQSKDNDTLILKFIRSEQPKFIFANLIKQFLCYAKSKHYTKVELEDDSMFNDEDCIFRALYYRVFQNKDSIYKDKGFQPIEDIQLLKKTLYEFKIIDAKNLAKLMTDKIKIIINSIPDMDNDNLFGTWLLKRECFFYREVFNRLSVISAQPVAKIDLLDINIKSKEFLKAYYKYKKLHETLIRNADCDTIASGGNIRHLSKTSRRKWFKCRKTRKNKRNYKTFSKKRNSKQNNI